MDIQVDSSGILDSAGVYALIWWAQDGAIARVVEKVASCPTGGPSHIATAIRVDHICRCTGCIGHTVQTVVGTVVSWFPHYSTVVGQGNTLWVLACVCIYPSTCEGQGSHCVYSISIGSDQYLPITFISMFAFPVFPTLSVTTHMCCPASYDHSLSRLTVWEDPLTKQLLPQVELHW